MTVRRSAGFSLVEMMVVVAIFGVIAFTVLVSLHTGVGAYESGVTFAQVQASSLTLCRMLADEVQHGRVIGVGNFAAGRAHTSLAIQTPVDWDQDGDMVDSTNTVEWGCREGRFVYLGGYVVYAFSLERVQNEAVLRVDLNWDGDLNDRFSIGSIHRIVRTAAGATISRGIVTGLVMVRNTAPGGGIPVADYNVEGDVATPSSADPMFKLTAFGTPEDGTTESATGNVVTVDLWFSLVDASGRAQRINRRERFALRNPATGTAPPVANMNP